MNKLIPLLAFSILLLVPVGAQSAFAATLAELLAGGSINFQDKQFTNFRDFQSEPGGPNAVAINPAFIIVEPTTFGDEIGLTFVDDPNNPQMIVGPFSQQDTLFFYDVVSLGPPIIDNTLQFNAEIFASSGIPSFATIQESVEDSFGTEIAFKDVRLQTGSPNKFSDHVVFAAQQMITINTDIGLASATGDSAASSQVFDFTQTFSQEKSLVGGEIIPIESVSLILANTQSFSWMIPVVLFGIGLFVVSRKSE